MVVDKLSNNTNNSENTTEEEMSSEQAVAMTSTTAITTTTTTPTPTSTTEPTSPTTSESNNNPTIVSSPEDNETDKESFRHVVITPSPTPTTEKRRFLITPSPSSPLPGQLVLTYSPSANEFGPTFRLLPPNNQIQELQTIIRDKNTSRSDFKFYADRLIRLVIEESLNYLPFKAVTITTPTNSTYEGLEYEKGNCGVSIVRSGEAMECGLRDCCRSIRIGKILVESDIDTHEAHVVYARFPEDISDRKVILMYPIMSSGNTVIKAVNVLREHLVREDNIILANLFSTPYAIKSVLNAFPLMKILTSEVNPITPNHFGTIYFGT